MNNKLLFVLWCMAISVMYSSCEKELDIKYHDIDALMVIEGELTQRGAKVSLTFTTPMDEPMDTVRYTNAEVRITDLTSGSECILEADADGYFYSPVAGIPGHEYNLIVKRGNYVYNSSTTMYGGAEIIGLEFNWIKMPYDYVAVLQGKIKDMSPLTGDYYWVKIFRNGKPYKWVLTDDYSAEDGIMTIMVMTSRKDTDQEDEADVLYDGDVITCMVCPISKLMYEYIEALRNGSNGYDMFVGDKCLGYFMATTPSEETIVFHPEDIPVYK